MNDRIIICSLGYLIYIRKTLTSGIISKISFVPITVGSGVKTGADVGLGVGYYVILKDNW